MDYAALTAHDLLSQFDPEHPPVSMADKRPPTPTVAHPASQLDLLLGKLKHDQPNSPPRTSPSSSFTFVSPFAPSSTSPRRHHHTASSSSVHQLPDIKYSLPSNTDSLVFNASLPQPHYAYSEPLTIRPVTLLDNVAEPNAAINRVHVSDLIAYITKPKGRVRVIDRNNGQRSLRTVASSTHRVIDLSISTPSINPISPSFSLRKIASRGSDNSVIVTGIDPKDPQHFPLLFKLDDDRQQQQNIFKLLQFSPTHPDLLVLVTSTSVVYRIICPNHVSLNEEWPSLASFDKHILSHGLLPPVRLPPQESFIHLAFSPDGSFVVLLSQESRIYIVPTSDTTTSQPYLRFQLPHKKPPTQIAFLDSPNSSHTPRYVAVTRDQGAILEIYDLLDPFHQPHFTFEAKTNPSSKRSSTSSNHHQQPHQQHQHPHHLLDTNNDEDDHHHDGSNININSAFGRMSYIKSTQSLLLSHSTRSSIFAFKLVFNQKSTYTHDNMSSDFERFKLARDQRKNASSNEDPIIGGAGGNIVVKQLREIPYSDPILEIATADRIEETAHPWNFPVICVVKPTGIDEIIFPMDAAGSPPPPAASSSMTITTPMSDDSDHNPNQHHSSSSTTTTTSFLKAVAMTTSTMSATIPAGEEKSLMDDSIVEQQPSQPLSPKPPRSQHSQQQQQENNININDNASHSGHSVAESTSSSVPKTVITPTTTNTSTTSAKSPDIQLPDHPVMSPTATSTASTVSASAAEKYASISSPITIAQELLQQQQQQQHSKIQPKSLTSNTAASQKTSVPVSESSENSKDTISTKKDISFQQQEQQAPNVSETPKGSVAPNEKTSISTSPVNITTDSFNDTKAMFDGFYTELSTFVQDELLKYETRMEANRVKSEAVFFEKLQTSLSSALSSASSTTSFDNSSHTTKVIESIVRDEIRKSVIPALNHSVKEIARQELDAKIIEPLQKSLPSALVQLFQRSEVSSSITRSVTSSIIPTLQNGIDRSIRTATSANLLPALHAGLGNSIEQLMNEMRSEMVDVRKEVVAEQSASLANTDEELVALREMVGSLVSQVASLKDSIAQQQQMLQKYDNNNNSNSNARRIGGGISSPATSATASSASSAAVAPPPVAVTMTTTATTLSSGSTTTTTNGATQRDRTITPPLPPIIASLPNVQPLQYHHQLHHHHQQQAFQQPQPPQQQQQQQQSHQQPPSYHQPQHLQPLQQQPILTTSKTNSRQGINRRRRRRNNKRNYEDDFLAALSGSSIKELDALIASLSDKDERDIFYNPSAVSSISSISSISSLSSDDEEYSDNNGVEDDETEDEENVGDDGPRLSQAVMLTLVMKLSILLKDSYSYSHPMINNDPQLLQRRRQRLLSYLRNGLHCLDPHNQQTAPYWNNVLETVGKNVVQYQDDYNSTNNSGNTKNDNIRGGAGSSGGVGGNTAASNTAASNTAASADDLIRIVSLKLSGGA